MQTPSKPGFSLERMSRQMRDAVARTGLDLDGMTVLTEAATGAYAVTPSIAALAGARRVFAVARSSRHGTAAEAAAWTMELAGSTGVAERITVVDAPPPDLTSVDIVTNSGHLRPLNAELIARLDPRCVIALMFEAWELREGDIDIDACRQRGIRIVGVNERHPSVDVFSYLGPLCVRLLHEAGLPVYRTRVALLCDNDFAPDIMRALKALGAEADLFASQQEVRADAWDCVVVALRPGPSVRIGASEAQALAGVAPQAVLAQFWGDVDRNALASCGFSIWPPQPPNTGHMAVLLSELGPDPIVRLQAGGLRAAEWVFRGGSMTPDGVAQIVL